MLVRGQTAPQEATTAMNRKRKALVVTAAVTAAALISGVALAAFNGRLKATSSVSALNYVWSAGGSTNEQPADGQKDPLAPGMTLTAAQREVFDVGAASAPTVVGGVLSTTVTAAYTGYRFTTSAVGNVTGGGSALFKVAGIAVTSTLPAGVTVAVGLEPADCNAPIGNGSALSIQFDTKFTNIPDGTAPFTLTYDVLIAPDSVTVSCNAWS